MTLVNGRGQLGDLLTKRLSDIKTIPGNLYHTWNFEDKSEETQQKEYNKLITFLTNHSFKKIIFISTKAALGNPYTNYKRLAEQYIIENTKDYLIIRLPNLIGKGICNRFKKDENIKPFGYIEFLSIEDACNGIITNINKDGLIELSGETISAKLTQKLITYGATNA